MIFQFADGETFDDQTGQLVTLSGELYSGLDGEDDGVGGVIFPGGIHLLGDYSALVYPGGGRSARVTGGASTADAVQQAGLSMPVILAALAAAYFFFFKRR